VSVVGLGLSGSNRDLVLILYLPLFCAGAVLIINIIYATWQTQQPKNAAATGMMFLIWYRSSFRPTPTTTPPHSSS
jgi:hypothetical protein